MHLPRVVSRLSAVLRKTTATRIGHIARRRKNLHISQLPVLSAGLTAGAFFLATDFYSNCDPRCLQERYRQDDLELKLALRDVPVKATEAAADVYSSIRRGVLKRINAEGGTPVAVLTAANVGVYLLWKGAPTSFMVRHFANSLESVRKGRVWTSITSNFSHMSIFHLTTNMYLLNRFGPDVASILGSERFYLFYGTAGLASSLASLTFRRLTRSNVMSLGASGAVVAILWLYACFFPDRRMALFGTDKTLTMQELVLAYTLIDAAGLLGSFGKIDFAAHLGGALYGNCWFYLVRDKLVQEEEARQRNRPAYLFGSFQRADDKKRNGD